jgi:hypothetical protein
VVVEGIQTGMSSKKDNNANELKDEWNDIVDGNVPGTMYLLGTETTWRSDNSANSSNVPGCFQAASSTSCRKETNDDGEKLQFGGAGVVLGGSAGSCT